MRQHHGLNTGLDLRLGLFLTVILLTAGLVPTADACSSDCGPCMHWEGPPDTGYCVLNSGAECAEYSDCPGGCMLCTDCQCSTYGDAELCLGECDQCNTGTGYCYDDNSLCSDCDYCYYASCIDPCPSYGKECDTVNDVCVECFDDGDCSSPTPFCSDAGECVECKSDANCNNPLETCGTCNEDGVCIDDDSKCRECGICQHRICYPDQSKCPKECDRCLISLTCEDYDPECSTLEVCIKGDCEPAGLCYIDEGDSCPFVGLCSDGDFTDKETCEILPTPYIQLNSGSWKCTQPPNKCYLSSMEPYCAQAEGCIWNGASGYCEPIQIWTYDYGYGYCGDKNGVHE
jgi:hypothetical protein